MAKRNRAGAHRVGYAAVPLIISLGLLQVFGPFTGPLAGTDLQSLGAVLPNSDFLPGELTFLAVVALHIAICAVTTWMAWNLLARTPGSALFARWGIWVSVSAVAGICLVFLAFPTVAGSLAFGTYAEFFRGTGTAPGFIEPFFLNVSPLALAIAFPTALGVVAVAMVSAAANAQLQLFYDIWRRRGADQAARLRQLHQRMKQCFYALAVVLVTSTVAASSFFHLPAGFPVAEKTPAAALIKRFSGFASELSLFWGVTFTLTLAAAVGVPLVLLHISIRQSLEPPFAGAAVQQRRLNVEGGLLSEGREQVKFVLTLLAPLCAGPVTNLLQSVARL
jgi:hypothetical protein